jgi:hypothetical protein
MRPRPRRRRADSKVEAWTRRRVDAPRKQGGDTKSDEKLSFYRFSTRRRVHASLRLRILASPRLSRYIFNLLLEFKPVILL